MFSRQNQGIIKTLQISGTTKLEMSIDNNFSLDYPYRDPKWKFVSIDPFLQSALGVQAGNTVILRTDMLKKPIACSVAEFYPISDIGLKIIRLSDFAKDKLNVSNNNQIFVERWDKIKAKKITIEYFIESWSLEQQLQHEELLLYLEMILSSKIKEELKALPVAKHDYFETSVKIENREEPLKVDYWVIRASPDFPITSIENETILEINSRAKILKNKKPIG